MTAPAALLADEVLSERPLRQWVLSLPYALRFPLATDPDSLTLVFRTVHRAISGFQLKTPYRDGTTHIVLDPLDLMARLAALVQPPRMHLTRFRGVFAQHSELRAARGAVDTLVHAIAHAPADGAIREGWLEQLFEAIQKHDPPDQESLDDRRGELCATSEMASRWAARLTGLVQHVHAETHRSQHAFNRAESACYSALFAAGQHDELIALIGGDPRPMWHDLLWIARCKVADGQIREAISLMPEAVNPWTPMAGLACCAEEILLQAGRRTEAYKKYALEANEPPTSRHSA